MQKKALVAGFEVSDIYVQISSKMTAFSYSTKFLALDLNPRTHKYEVNMRLIPGGCDLYKRINPLPI